MIKGKRMVALPGTKGKVRISGTLLDSLGLGRVQFGKASFPRKFLEEKGGARKRKIKGPNKKWLPFTKKDKEDVDFAYSMVNHYAGLVEQGKVSSVGLQNFLAAVTRFKSLLKGRFPDLEKQGIGVESAISVGKDELRKEWDQVLIGQRVANSIYDVISDRVIRGIIKEAWRPTEE